MMNNFKELISWFTGSLYIWKCPIHRRTH